MSPPGLKYVVIVEMGNGPLLAGFSLILSVL